MLSEYEIEYRLLKKQLKLSRGIEKAPAEHRERLSDLLSELKTRTGSITESAMVERLEFLKNELERSSHKQKLKPDIADRAWFLRPLLAHLDHPGKVKALADPKIGVAALKTTLNLHIPPELNFVGLADRNARRFFSFKSLGKSSAGSKELMQKFSMHVQATYEMPFHIPGITDLPFFHYNIDQFWTHTVSEQRDVCIVSGICPISMITNEFVFETKNSEKLRPDLGFEPLAPETVCGGSRIERVHFPPRPLLADYIELSHTFALAKYFSNNFPERKVSVKLWLPRYEYELALREEAYSLLLDKNLIDVKPINADLGVLCRKYKELVGLVIDELGFDGDVKIQETDERSITGQTEELEVLLKKPLKDIIDQDILRVYGLYQGSMLRKQLFALLAFKHFQPLLEDPDVNVLHIENSYELWPSVLAARWAEDWCARSIPECGEQTQAFAFICTPSVPSPSLKYMRTLNAPYEHKIYLGAPQAKLEEQLKHLPSRYLELINPLLVGAEKIKNSKNSPDMVLKSKLRVLNSHFS